MLIVEALNFCVRAADATGAKAFRLCCGFVRSRQSRLFSSFLECLSYIFLSCLSFHFDADQAVQFVSPWDTVVTFRFSFASSNTVTLRHNFRPRRTNVFVVINCVTSEPRNKAPANRGTVILMHAVAASCVRWFQGCDRLMKCGHFSSHRCSGHFAPGRRPFGHMPLFPPPRNQHPADISLIDTPT